MKCHNSVSVNKKIENNKRKMKNYKSLATKTLKVSTKDHTKANSSKLQ